MFKLLCFIFLLTFHLELGDTTNLVENSEYFITKSAAAEVVVGQEFKYKCLVDADKIRNPRPPVLKLEKIDGDKVRIITNATGLRLYQPMSNIQKSDAGIYRCTVMSGSRHIFNTLNVTVIDDPGLDYFFPIKPKSVSVHESGEAVFSCVLPQRYPSNLICPTFVQWTKNSVPFYKGLVTVQDFSVEFKATITLSHVQLSDAGEYICEAYMCGIRKKIPVTLTVITI